MVWKIRKGKKHIKTEVNTLLPYFLVLLNFLATTFQSCLNVMKVMVNSVVIAGSNVTLAILYSCNYLHRTQRKFEMPMVLYCGFPSQHSKLDAFESNVYLPYPESNSSTYLETEKLMHFAL